ncbi:MAG TPA: hypothetical protein VN947_01580 [Polyangia bacterium]|nr:hypothetical protein [Polyangia bacterium]
MTRSKELIKRLINSALVVAALAAAGCASGDDTSIAMSFARASFWDAPFPSDDLRRADGTIDVSRIPNPNGVDIVTQLLALVARDARGFSLAGGIFFRASAPLDPASLPDAAGSLADAGSVFVVPIDPDAPDYLHRVPLDVAFTADGGPFGAPNLLALLPIQGIPLRAHTRYAAVVTRNVRDAHGRRLAAMPAPDRSDYADALATIAPLVAASGVAGLAVFTTDDPAAQVGLVRDDAVAAHPLALPATPPALLDTYDDFCVFRTTIDLPVYQSGAPPYQNSGGDWLFDAAGRPLFDHMETSRIVFTIPRAPMPAAGWPTVVFVRTGGGGDDPLVDRGPATDPTFNMPVTPGTGPAMEFARVGYAGVQIDGPLGGLRNTTNGDEDFLIFNVLNPAALRDNVRQSAMELSLVARALPSLGFDASACSGTSAAPVAFDLAHLALMGHSMGSWIAPLALAFEPRFGAAVLSGAGASYIANVMDKIKPIHVRPYAEILLDYNMDQRSLDAHDPALTLFQWATESSDPQAYDRRIVREPAAGESPRHVLMLQGIVDHYILPSIANATSLALGLDAAGPLYDAGNAEEQSLAEVPLAARLPLAGLQSLALPVAGNVGGATTAIVVQHPGDAIEDGHEVVFQTDPPKHQYRCFLRSFADGATPRVPPDGAADDPCP